MNTGDPAFDDKFVTSLCSEVGFLGPKYREGEIRLPEAFRAAMLETPEFDFSFDGRFAKLTRYDWAVDATLLNGALRVLQYASPIAREVWERLGMTVGEPP